MRPEDDPGWASYAETILVVHGTHTVEIDLARPPGARVSAALAECGLDGPFGLVTPCNPRGRPATPSGNATLLRTFLAELDASATRYVRVDGVSPDRLHVEPGVALALPMVDVLALARRWEQSAIYWWDGAAFWVIGALTDSTPWRLGAHQ